MGASWSSLQRRARTSTLTLTPNPLTPTLTVSLTPTLTVTLTPTLTVTLTPTLTSILTLTLTPTPTPTPTEGVGALLPRAPRRGAGGRERRAHHGGAQPRRVRPHVQLAAPEGARCTACSVSRGCPVLRGGARYGGPLYPLTTVLTPHSTSLTCPSYVHVCMCGCMCMCPGAGRGARVGARAAALLHGTRHAARLRFTRPLLRGRQGRRQGTRGYYGAHAHVCARMCIL